MPGTNMQGLHSTQVRHHTKIDLLTCFVKHMMIHTQVRHHTHLHLSTCRVCSIKQRSGDFQSKKCFDAGKIGLCHRALVFQKQVPKGCTDLDFSLLYILILKTSRKNNFLALGICFPQPCSSSGRSLGCIVSMYV